MDMEPILSVKYNSATNNLHEKQQEVEPIPPENVIYTVSRGDGFANCGWNYSGASCTNSFKVNRPINLDGIGFFGPFNDKPARYTYLVEIYISGQPTIDRYGLKLDEIRGHYIARDKNVFFIKVSKEDVRIDPGFWCHIRFYLDGPDMATLKDWETTNTSLSVPVGDGGNETVEFEFLKGSKQMPRLEFRLALGEQNEVQPQIILKNQICAIV